MNVIAIMNHMGVYFKEEPIRELHKALETLDFRVVYPNDREDLLKLIENNARLCGIAKARITAPARTTARCINVNAALPGGAGLPGLQNRRPDKRGAIRRRLWSSL